MSTITAVYIKAQDKEPIISALKKLTGLKSVTEEAFSANIRIHYILGENASPTWLAIRNTQPGWITIYHNTIGKLTGWGNELSKKLDTILIIMAAQTTSDYYYFCLFEKGKKLREIEVCYGTDFDAVDFGEKFPFEKINPGNDDDYFGFDEIQNYCTQFGLQLEEEEGNTAWTILKAKPRWKFW